MIFGREPAAISALIKAFIALLSLTIITLSDGQQAALNAVTASALGFYVAWQVVGEKALPMLIGLVEAGVYVAIHFGVNVSTNVQAALLVFVGALVAVITRDRVVAPVGPSGEHVG